MPPYRTMSSMQKPLKTERTHEENQERAYIAASRRSDRSLEARLESARRASEIHKKRTGRALRVTEQDVLNEEMYEEEDDDIPFAYRRMTAHMQIDNPEFHRKFQAYMATQMESRRQLTQAVMNSYQQNPNLYGQGSGHPQSPFTGQNMMQMPSNTWQQTGGMPPQMFNRSPSVNTAQRSGPYPGSNGMQQNMRPASHGRSMSIGNPQGIQTPQMPTPGPYASQTAHSSPVMVKKEGTSPTTLSSAGRMSPSQSQSGNKRKREDDQVSPTAFKEFASNDQPTPRQMPTPPHQSQPQRHYSYGGPLSAGSESQQVWSNPTGPFTTTLPANTQDILSDNPHFDMNDPMFAMMMPPQQQQPFSYSYNPNGKPKNNNNGMGQQSSMQGLNQTLSLDTNADANNYDNSLPSAGTDYLDSAALDPSYNFGNFGQDLFGPNSGYNSGTGTPGDNGWMDSYLHESFGDDLQIPLA